MWCAQIFQKSTSDKTKLINSTDLSLYFFLKTQK